MAVVIQATKDRHKYMHTHISCIMYWYMVNIMTGMINYTHMQIINTHTHSCIAVYACTFICEPYQSYYWQMVTRICMHACS